MEQNRSKPIISNQSSNCNNVEYQWNNLGINGTVSMSMFSNLHRLRWNRLLMLPWFILCSLTAIIQLLYPLLIRYVVLLLRWKLGPRSIPGLLWRQVRKIPYSNPGFGDVPEMIPSKTQPHDLFRRFHHFRVQQIIKLLITMMMLIIEALNRTTLLKSSFYPDTWTHMKCMKYKPRTYLICLCVRNVIQK